LGTHIRAAHITELQENYHEGFTNISDLYTFGRVDGTRTIINFNFISERPVYGSIDFVDPVGHGGTVEFNGAVELV